MTNATFSIVWYNSTTATSDCLVSKLIAKFAFQDMLILLHKSLYEMRLYLPSDFEGHNL